MRPRDIVELLLLSVLWGAAYLFMRAAVPAFGPAPLAALRLGMAGLLLLPVMVARGGLPVLRAHPRELLLLGVPLTALPFLLLAFASLHMTAGLVAVLNATAPLFAALIGHYVLHERLGRWRSSGLVIGFAGVALLTWGSATLRLGQRRAGGGGGAGDLDVLGDRRQLHPPADGWRRRGGEGEIYEFPAESAIWV